MVKERITRVKGSCEGIIEEKRDKDDLVTAGNGKSGRGIRWLACRSFDEITGLPFSLSFVLFLVLKILGAVLLVSILCVCNGKA